MELVITLAILFWVVRMIWRFFAWLFSIKPEASMFVRLSGAPEVLSTKAAKARYARVRERGVPCVRIGPLAVPFEEFFPGMVTFGESGTGKSSLKKVFAGSLAAEWMRGANSVLQSVLYFDRKGDEWLPQAATAPAHVRVASYNVFRPEGTAFDFYRSCPDEPSLKNWAANAIAEDNNEKKFWVVTPRELYEAGLAALHARRGGATRPYDLYDTLLLASHPDLLVAVCKQHGPSATIADAYLRGDTLSKGDIFASLRAALGPLVLAAKHARACTQSMSVDDFYDQPTAAVMDANDDTIESLRPYYRLITRFTVTRGLCRTGASKYVGLIADEAHELGPMADRIAAVAERGRSSKLFVVASTLGVEAMDKAYGPKERAAFLAPFRRAVCFRSGYATAKWFSDLVGSQRGVETDYAFSSPERNYAAEAFGRGQSIPRETSSETHRLKDREAIAPSEISSLPDASWRKDCLRFYLRDPIVGVAEMTSRFRGAVEKAHACPVYQYRGDIPSPEATPAWLKELGFDVDRPEIRAFFSA